MALVRGSRPKKCVVGAERLVVAVGGGVHQVHQGAVAVLGQQRVPPATPDDLDDVPAGPAEPRLELLDDLAVAADRTVEPLQVAVDDEGQVVELVVGRDMQHSAGLRLVHLTVAEERPDVLLRRVLDPTVGQVLVELRLVDRVHRAKAHRHGGELPEVGHVARVRVARQSRRRLAVDDVRALLAEPIHLRFGQPSLEEGAGIHAGGGVALEVDLVAATLVVTSTEEVVEADLVKCCRRGVGGDVATHADAGSLGAVDHDRGVPAHEGAEAALDILIAGEPGLSFRGDGVDVVGGRQRGNPHLALAGSFEQLAHQVSGPGATACLDDSVQGVQPLLGLIGIDVRDLTRDAVQDGSGVLACHHVESLLATSESLVPATVDGVAGCAPVTSAIFLPEASNVTPCPLGVAPTSRGEATAGGPSSWRCSSWSRC